MTKTTTKSRRAVGTLGLAAVIAVLTVSMIAMNFTSQPAQGAAQSANKVGTAVDFISFVTDFDDAPSTAVLVEYSMKSSDKHDWLSTFTTECTTQTIVKASGSKGNKDKSTDTARVGAWIWWTITDENGDDHLIDAYGNIDTNVYVQETTNVPDRNKWHICGQEMQLEVDLNPLIIKCPDPETQECNEGQLVFACDFDETIPEDECDQYVQIFLANWGTHSAVALINDVPHGVYDIKVWGANELTLSDNVDQPDIDTTVILGKKVLVNTPILMDNTG